MKKILKTTLLFIFALLTLNQIWNNISFGHQVIVLIKAAFVLALFELIIKPVVKILLLPVNLLTLGLFRIIIETIGLYLAVFLLNDFSLSNINLPATTWQGFAIPALKFSGFFAYLVSSVTLSLILQLFNKILYKKY